MEDTKAINFKYKYCEITVSEAGPEKDLIYKTAVFFLLVSLVLSISFKVTVKYGVEETVNVCH